MLAKNTLIHIEITKQKNRPSKFAYKETTFKIKFVKFETNILSIKNKINAEKMKWEMRIRGIACVLASSGHFVTIEKKYKLIHTAILLCLYCLLLNKCKI